jgi:miniconductance mechanosensitive channel
LPSRQIDDSLARMNEFLNDWYVSKGMPAASAQNAAWWTQAVLLSLCAVALHFLLKLIVVIAVHPVLNRLRFEIAKAIVSSRALIQLVHLIPAVFLYHAAPSLLGTATSGTEILRSLTLLYILFASVFAIYSLINGIVTLYEKHPVSREVPATSFVQVIKLVVGLIAVILGVSVLLNRSPILILSGLGAMTAVLLLIFKDAILGFVAGIQLAANRMIAVGDWIEMPKYGADGDVEEVALTTVKVRNWDKTRTTIPTYALISDSFKNWRGMQESGGRRIKRAIHIDLDSVKLMDPVLRERLGNIRHLRDYLAEKDRELAEWHEQQGTISPDDINRRHLTNIGTFRAYIERYLRRHPKIYQDMTLLVRQLPPDDRGLPIEIYCFTNDIRWAVYESIQADIFDHLIAVAREFDLRLFQQPSGNDLRTLAAASAA